MNRNDELERLHGRAESLEKSIDGIDQDIERATHDFAGGGDPGQVISFLQERHGTQLGLMYDLGKVEAQIERLEHLILEEQEQPEERLAAERWQQQLPITPEDHLDWFKQSLAENAPQHQDLDTAEQRMLHDMEREPAPDDYLDWLPRR